MSNPTDDTDEFLPYTDSLRSNPEAGTTEGLLRGKPVGALINSLDILEYMAGSDRSLGVTEIARALDINRSTCFNILKTLAAREIVRFDEYSKTYEIGHGLVELARGALDPAGELDAIWPQMAQIAVEYQIVVTAWRRTGRDRIVLVSRADSEAPVRIHMTLGQRLPLLSGSMGRVMAAFGHLEESEIRSALAQVRWHRPISLSKLLADAQNVRDIGYAVDDGDFLRGITSVSAPLLEGPHHARLIICATTFTDHLSAEDIESLGQRLTSVRHRSPRGTGQSGPTYKTSRGRSS